MKHFFLTIFLSIVFNFTVLNFTVLSAHAVNHADTLNSLNNFQLKLKVDGLGVPWAMAFISDNDLLVSERSGVLKRVRFLGNKTQIEEVKGLPQIMSVGQGGLLDVRVAPEVVNSEAIHSKEMPIIYFTYVATSSLVGKKNLPTLKLARAKLDGAQLINVEELFEANHPQRGGRHFGSRIAFDGKGHVFFSMGDRGERENSQKLSHHAGSIFRLYLDGSIPTDNPFISKQGAMPEIWSYGHRNPQGLMFDAKKRFLWSIEHGPRGGDEINLIARGENYGWPVISYGREYVSNLKVSASAFKEGMQQPIHYFTPSIAPGSLLVYSGKKFAHLEGALLSGALKLRHLNIVMLDQEKKFSSENRLFEKRSFRVRSVAENPSGDVFISTDSGDIFQLEVRQ